MKDNVPCKWELDLIHKGVGLGEEIRLCKYNGPTRAQAFAIACHTTLSARDLMDQLRNLLFVCTGELDKETDFGLYELAEHLRHCGSAFAALSSLANSSIIQNLGLMQKDPEFFNLATALQEDLASLRSYFDEIIVKPLNNLMVSLNEHYMQVRKLDRKDDRIKKALIMVRQGLWYISSEFCPSLANAAEFLDEIMRKKWKRNRGTIAVQPCNLPAGK